MAFLDWIQRLRGAPSEPWQMPLQGALGKTAVEANPGFLARLEGGMRTNPAIGPALMRAGAAMLGTKGTFGDALSQGLLHGVDSYSALSQMQEQQKMKQMQLLAQMAQLEMAREEHQMAREMHPAKLAETQARAKLIGAQSADKARPDFQYWVQDTGQGRPRVQRVDPSDTATVQNLMSQGYLPEDIWRSARAKDPSYADKLNEFLYRQIQADPQLAEQWVKHKTTSSTKAKELPPKVVDEMSKAMNALQYVDIVRKHLDKFGSFESMRTWAEANLGTDPDAIELNEAIHNMRALAQELSVGNPSDRDVALILRVFPSLFHGMKGKTRDQVETQINMIDAAWKRFLYNKGKTYAGYDYEMPPDIVDQMSSFGVDLEGAPPAYQSITERRDMVRGAILKGKKSKSPGSADDFLKKYGGY